MSDKKKFVVMKRPNESEAIVHSEDVKHRLGLGWKVVKKPSEKMLGLLETAK